MATVEIILVERRDGKTVTTPYMCPEGPTLGKKLRRLFKCKPMTLYSVDIHGHVQEEDGPIEDKEVIYVRRGREFMIRAEEESK